MPAPGKQQCLENFLQGGIMKKHLLLVVSLLLAAHPVLADHIAPYTDETGSSCNIASGFSTTAALIQKFSSGTYGCRFALDLSAAPGSDVLALQTPYTWTGLITLDLSVGYGQCLSGDIVIGTMVAIWAPGAISVVPALGQPYLLWLDCNFQELPGSGGHASIDGDGHGCDYDAVEQSTWGQVKALYR